jgi:hypothetical protein
LAWSQPPEGRAKWTLRLLDSKVHRTERRGARQLHRVHMGGISWLEAAAKAFSKILVEKGYLSREEQNIFAMSVEEMKTDMRNNN